MNSDVRTVAASTGCPRATFWRSGQILTRAV